MPAAALAEEQARLPAALAEEQARLAAAREALARMLDTARLRVATGASVAGDRYTAETLGRMLKSHVKELTEEPDGPLYFGRLWFGASPAAGEHRDERYYLGRRHITDESGQPIVIDWRAPVSRAFYRASTRDPLGVRERRRYGWTGRHPAELTGFEDERLDGGTSVDVASRLVAAEIERPRIGPMRDIVATIQPEQDDLVRADLDRSVCVQGGPGSGKTAVGLHRAAYLLYTHRRQMKRGGVLVVGPNPAFLRYISAVLPALGEVDALQQTLAELVGGHPVGATDSEAAATVKHDPRMAGVLHRALYQRIGEPTGPLVVPDGSYRWRLPVEWLRRIVTQVRAEAPPYAIGRERLRSRVVGLLQRRAEGRAETPGGAWLRRMARCRPVTAFLDEVWPATRPEELLALLFGDPTVLARASAGVLDAEEQAVLRWQGRPRTARTAAWTAADRVLLDEVAGLLDHPAGHRHIVVDEAQDLSPMQCRAIARRSRHGSLTVLGDLAQGTTPWAASDWPDQLAHLGQPAATVVPLTAGFRVPAVVLELANRLLPELGVRVAPTRSVRTDGTLRVRAVPDLATATTEAVGAALGLAGSIGVIAADTRLPRLTEALRSAGIAVADPDADDEGVRVTALPASLAKGLEYDHVIVVEPAEIVEAEPRGPHRLYVVLTRAVSRLDVLHQRALPPALRG
ncbi:HelD family protein [Plantactinospora soyae]|nr:AAA family ATPase [Plantactinospora soyae]